MKKLLFNSACLSVVAVVVPLCCLCADGYGFDREAGTKWQDGLFVGNGQHGVIGYAPAHFEWVINRNDLFDRRVAKCDYTPHAAVMEHVRTNVFKNVDYLVTERAKPFVGTSGHSSSVSAAILRVRFWSGVGWSAPATPLVRQSLDMAKGELVERMTSPEFPAEAVTVVPHEPDVVAIAIDNPARVFRGIVIELSRPEDPRLESAPEVICDGEMVSFVQRLPYGDSYAVAMRVKGAKAEQGRSAAVIETRDRAEIILAVRSERSCADPRAEALAAVKAASESGFAALRGRNAAWWTDFWRNGGRAEWTSEPGIDRAWKHALFALAAQFSEAPMPALNGLTYGPLDSGYAGVGAHLYVQDQNVQIPLLPFFPLGRCDVVRTFAKSYTDVLPELHRRTREMFGVEGVYLPANMNADGVEIPTGNYRYTLCASAYSGLVLTKAWQYSRDEKLLREVYPLLREFVRFYVATMSRDTDGSCHFLWSVPPEIFTGTRDELCIVACLKPCLETVVEASELFGCDQVEAKVWRDVLAHYPVPARHPDGGWWCGPEIPFDHYMYGGHLMYPFFPAESFPDAEAALQTLRYALEKGVETCWSLGSPRPRHEWSALYTGMARLRLNGPEDGWKSVTEFLDLFGKPNGLFSHNPVIVTNIAAAELEAVRKALKPNVLRSFNGQTWNSREDGAGADLTSNPEAKRNACPVLEGAAAFLLLSTEALLQSTDSEIRLFPCVPPGFTGRFDGFLVKGGRRVSAEMRNGRVVKADVSGDRSGVRVSCPTDPGFGF